MKSSKPFAFVLWVDDDRLPKYVAERVKCLQHFDYFHYIRHEAEQERPNILKRATKQKPKRHYHCAIHFRKATDYETMLVALVHGWTCQDQALVDKYGALPFTFARTHEGKINNLSTWLAYVVHEPRYMAYIESHCDRPETYKTAYSWDDIKSTDYDILEAQVQNALAFIDKCDQSANNFEHAKELGEQEARLTDALRHCTTYNQMLVVKSMFFAKEAERGMDEGRP